MGKTEKVILAIILFIGAFLRIYNYWDFSLSNDELSALARLNFTSFSDLIENGVKIDGHPAAAQVVLYYATNLFGNSVAVVRLPFVLAGLASIYFMYQLGKEWVSSSAGLLSAAAFATLAFPLLYSRIARPYALGMLFALMAAYFWIRVIRGKNSISDLIFLAVSLALCAYSHYFAALVAAMLAITGTFLITGKQLKTYLFVLVAAFFLYIPYLPIFLHQLSLGGVGQWLGPPGTYWIFEHLFYVFNESWPVVLGVILLAVVGWITFKPKFRASRFILPLSFFLFPFLVGFGYSVYVNPVMQHSTLLFSFPFLLIFLFSGWEDTKPLFTKVAVSFLGLIVLSSTLVEKRFYSINHFGVFKELAEHIDDWTKELDTDVLLVGDFNYPDYINYYLTDTGERTLDLYRTTDEKGMANLKSLVSNTKRENLIYTWSTVNQAPEVEEIIRMKFPVELKRKTYFNSEAVLFTRGEYSSPSEEFSFEKTDIWNFNPDSIQVDSLGLKSVLISADNPYGPTIALNLLSIEEKGFTEVIVEIKCSGLDENSSCQMVYEQANENGGYAWESDEFRKQFISTGPNWGVFHYQIKEMETNEDVLKIYPWLPNGETVSVQRMAVRFR